MIKDRRALEALIDRPLIVEGFGSQKSLLDISKPAELDLKIALLSLLLEELQYERNPGEELVNFEKYFRCHVSTNDNAIIITAPEDFEDVGAGTAPIQLQSTLLVFLLLHHRERYPVLDIIRLLIEEIRPGLTFLDFKKTKTGVTRCFTNTRFAAKVLREYGLLKFSQREAFKTWELSLTGFLVAASILQRKKQTSADLWKIPVIGKDHHSDLAPEVWAACDGIDGYDVFLNRLTSISAPKASVFRTFQVVLPKAYRLIDEYRKTLNNSDLRKKDRKAALHEILKKLEQEGITEEFYAELSASIKNADEFRTS